MVIVELISTIARSIFLHKAFASSVLQRRDHTRRLIGVSCRGCNFGRVVSRFQVEGADVRNVISNLILM